MPSDKALNRTSPKIISRAKCSKKERFEYWLYGLCSIFDGLVIVLSIGFVASDLKSWFLFDYIERK